MNFLRTAQNSGECIACGVPWLLLSYLPYPRPLRVRNQAMLGTRSGFSPRAPSSTVRVTGPHSDPSMVPVTRQPYGANHDSGVPCTTLEMGGSSMP